MTNVLMLLSGLVFYTTIILFLVYIIKLLIKKIKNL